MRRRRAEVRKVPPDPIYNDVLVSQLLNRVMWDGTYSIAQQVG